MLGLGLSQDAAGLSERARLERRLAAGESPRRALFLVGLHIAIMSNICRFELMEMLNDQI